MTPVMIFNFFSEVEALAQNGAGDGVSCDPFAPDEKYENRKDDGVQKHELHQ